MPLLARVRPASEAGGRLHPQARRHIDLLHFIRMQGNVRPTSSILDVGCGTGALARRLRAAGFTHISGVDWLQPTAVPSDLFEEYRQADLNEEGLAHYARASFDCLVCSDVLEHLERPALMLREFARLTKPGGCIYITLPNAFNLVERVALLLTGNSKRYRTERPGEFGHISLFPSNVLLSLLNRAGLKVLAEGRGFAAIAGLMVFPTMNFGPWASYCRYYCFVHRG